MAPTDRRAKSPLLLRLLLSGVTALVAGELALRGLDLAQGRDPLGPQLADESFTSLRYQPHPYMGFALKPDNPGEGVNALGLRGPLVARSKPQGVYRILCIGGSTTYGSHVSADQTYPARLQELLQAADHEHPPERYEVLNCGVPGYTTAESLVNLSLRLVDYDADALLIYHAINDARLIQVGGFRSDYSHMRTSWKRPVISPWEWFLLRHSRVFLRLFHDAYVDPAQLRLEQLIYVDPQRHPHPPPTWKGVNPRGVETFVRNLRSLLAVAREHGIAPVLTTFAASDEQLVGPGYADVLKVLNGQIRRLARERKLPLIELAGPLGKRPELFADYVHLNAAGCQAQARMVYQQARAQGLWRLR